MSTSATNGGPRGVIWDLDGTLIDSGEQHYVAWRDTLAARGREHSREEFASYFGRRNDVILAEMFGGALEPGEAERIADEKEERYRSLVRADGLEPLPGVLDWLRRLHDEGYRQALGTMAPRMNVSCVLEVLGIGPLLDASAAAEDTVVGKPDPGIFLEAARRMDVATARCVVVEDAPAGLEGARRAGMRCVGVLSGHHPHLEADIVVPSLASLPPGAIEGLLGA